jgi:propanol-preferring alcohol dehydrogenase
LRAELPSGGRLGLYGFGGSAHITAQVALAAGATVYVFTRSDEDQALARRLGAAFVGGAAATPPEPLDAAILFAPVGSLVPPALAGLDRGGTLAIAGIHLSDIPPLNYAEHLFEERTLRSVTANTRADGVAFLALADRIGIETTTRRYRFEEVDNALADLAHDGFSGAAVIAVNE